MNINHIYIIYVVLWPLISTLFLPIDAAGRMYMILACITLLYNINKSTFISTIKITPIVVWLFWGIYVAIIWLLIGKNSTNLNSTGFIFLKIFLPIISMIVSCCETRKNPHKFIIFLFCIYFIYVVIGVLFEKESSTEFDRGGTLLGNSLPLTAVCCCFIASLCEHKGWINKYILFTCFALAMICILTTATRKAFFALFIVVILWYIAKNKTLNLGSFIKLSFFGLVIYIIVTTILNNSLIGERFFEAASNENKFNSTNNAFLELLGDRAIFYIEGWELFLQNPIWGIGLRNFMVDFNYLHPIHSEFMVQISETGIIGTTLYIFFYISTIKLILRTKGNNCNSNVFLIMLGYIMTILFISLTSWIYEFSRYYVIFGLIIGYSSYLINSRNENSTHN